MGGDKGEGGHKKLEGREMRGKEYSSLFTIHFSLRQFFLLLSFALFAGCATMEDVGKVQWEVSGVRAEVSSVRAEVSGVRDEIAKAKEKVQSLEETQKAMGRGQSELLSRVGSLTREVQVISGRLEERQHLSEEAVKKIISDQEVIIAQLKDLGTKVKELKELKERL
ncbi:MAG TPA: hypothetical protein DEP99_04235, partial [Nitrospiraceae bacterium]|nr:hypothetical protein [Nitrospiraceae bacterium]